MFILGILGYMLTRIKENPPNPAKTHTYSTASATTAAHQPIQVYKCQDCLKWPTVQKKYNENPVKRLQHTQTKLVKKIGARFWWFFTGFSRPFHGSFTVVSRTVHGPDFVGNFREVLSSDHILFCIWWHHDLRCRRLRRARAPRHISLASNWTKWHFYPHIYWPLSPNITF